MFLRRGIDEMEAHKCATLVYQAGIANVIELTRGEQKRLIQSDFHSCEMFARGLAHAGYTVKTAWANVAGDVMLATWEYDRLHDAPFFESMHPVVAN